MFSYLSQEKLKRGKDKGYRNGDREGNWGQIWESITYMEKSKVCQNGCTCEKWHNNDIFYKLL